MQESLKTRKEEEGEPHEYSIDRARELEEMDRRAREVSDSTFLSFSAKPFLGKISSALN
jgi:hypothetical protein